MRKGILLFVVSFVLFASLQAQSTKNVIKFNFVNLIFGEATFPYERVLTPNSSIVISPSYGESSQSGSGYSDNIKKTRMGIGFEYRAYLKNPEPAPSGVYFAPGINYTYRKDNTTSTLGTTVNQKASIFNIKVVFGKQWVYKNHFVLDLNGGLQHTSDHVSDNTINGDDTQASGFFPALAFSVGYTF